jgi:hypothetical protein
MVNEEQSASDQKQDLTVMVLSPGLRFRRLCFLACGLGLVCALLGLFLVEEQVFWKVYYSNALFFLGLSSSGVVLAALLQLVRAQWAGPLQRLAEAQVEFLPAALLFFMFSYFGKAYLFPAAALQPHLRAWWMQTDFVYLRFLILFLVLYLLMRKYLKFSLRGDLGLLQTTEQTKATWSAEQYQKYTRDWRGLEDELALLQQKLSVLAPLVTVFYVVIASFFGFEMVMALDRYWYSSLFGLFWAAGNLYLSWAVLGVSMSILAKRHAQYAQFVSLLHFWDLGKVVLGFGLLWGYLFYSQFLTQWYGNLPEETQWLIARFYEQPWQTVGWCALVLCFLLPCLLLLSAGMWNGVRNHSRLFFAACLSAIAGLWLEKLVIVMPPAWGAFNAETVFALILLVGLFAGFLGLYLLRLSSFLGRYPLLVVTEVGLD